MTNEAFICVLENRITAIRSVLASKAAEYASGEDRLHNFKRAGEMTRTTQQKALLGMLAKHLVSVVDIVESGRQCATAVIEEKIGDAINYLILLEAVLKETSK